MDETIRNNVNIDWLITYGDGANVTRTLERSPILVLTGPNVDANEYESNNLLKIRRLCSWLKDIYENKTNTTVEGNRGKHK